MLSLAPNNVELEDGFILVHAASVSKTCIGPVPLGTARTTDRRFLTIRLPGRTRWH
jgi:hypothetical protein